MPVAPELRTPAVELTLELVRCRGGSAHPQRGEVVSATTFDVAVFLGRNPVEVQAEIERYADANDAAVRASLAQR
jgi:hypothetical protein